MKYYFLESSAVVKLFVLEKGSDATIDLVESLEDDQKIVSSLAFIEVRSAIRRRQRAGEILTADANLALNDFTIEVKRMVEQPITLAVIETASQLIDRYPLRALDAIQLATCMVARDIAHTTDVCFVASDLILLEAAAAEHFELMNPEQQP